MSDDGARDLREALAIEEADAWFEYLEATREKPLTPAQKKLRELAAAGTSGDA